MHLTLSFRVVKNLCPSFIYLFIYFSLYKVDLHLNYEKPINVNSNAAYISVNKLPNNNNNNKTKYLILRRNQQVANRLYITYMGNEAFFFLFCVWKILVFHNFLLFREQATIYLELCKIWFWYHILQNWDFYFEERFESETKQVNSVIEFCIFGLD